MKYRMLTEEEMQLFDEDFNYFLIVNGVSNEEWLEFNSTNLTKAKNLVEMFSDTVLQKVYEKVRFIEFRSIDSCMVFHCEKDKMELISINRKSNSSVDLSTPGSIHQALTKHAEELTFFKTEKKYSTDRETEVHALIEKGCVNSTEEFWKALDLIVQ